MSFHPMAVALGYLLGVATTVLLVRFAPGVNPGQFLSGVGIGVALISIGFLIAGRRR